MGFSYSEHNFMQFLCRSPCRFIPWVAFLIQDTAEWRPFVVNTPCGRCYRQITRCYSHTYNKCPCQVPCTAQAFYICYLIYPSQPTKSRHLRQHPDFTDEQPEMENILCPSPRTQSQKRQGEGPTQGVSEGRPHPCPPCLSSFMMDRVFPSLHGQTLCLSPLCIP